MSFILDALKKSETERQQQTGAEFASVPSSPDEPKSLKWLWVLAALLVLNVAVLLGILLRPDAPSPRPVTELQPGAGPAPVSVSPGAVREPSFEEQLAAAQERQAGREQAAAAQAAPAPEAIPARAPEVAPAPAATAPTRRRLATIDELRLENELQVPDLHLDIHVYSDVPEERFVFINMVKHRERSRLDEGPVVSEITPDGVILDYRGRRFLLPRE